MDVGNDWMLLLELKGLGSAGSLGEGVLDGVGDTEGVAEEVPFTRLLAKGTAKAEPAKARATAKEVFMMNSILVKTDEKCLEKNVSKDTEENYSEGEIGLLFMLLRRHSTGS